MKTRDDTRVTLAEKRLEEGFTAQEKQYLLFLLNGVKPLAAAKAVGATVPAAFVQRLNDDPRAQEVMAQVPAFQTEKVEITRDMLNVMLLDSHSRAATATEEIMAIRELGKMNDLYADAKHKGLKIVNNIGTTQVSIAAKRIEALSDEELLRLSGDDILTLDPADYHRIEDRSDERQCKADNDAGPKEGQYIGRKPEDDSGDRR